MIIYPSKAVPINKPEAPLTDIALFPIYQTRDDVFSVYPADQAAKILPPCNPNRRAKHWFDPDYVGAEDDGEVVIYDVVQINPVTGAPVLDADGRPKITKMAMSKDEAGTLNIGTGVANEFPSNTAYMRLKPHPFPIRPLHQDEEIVLAPGFGSISGAVIVRNKALAALKPLPSGVFTEEDRRILFAIARKLGVIS